MPPTCAPRNRCAAIADAGKRAVRAGDPRRMVPGWQERPTAPRVFVAIGAADHRASGVDPERRGGFAPGSTDGRRPDVVAPRSAKHGARRTSWICPLRWRKGSRRSEPAAVRTLDRIRPRPLRRRLAFAQGAASAWELSPDQRRSSYRNLLTHRATEGKLHSPLVVRPGWSPSCRSLTASYRGGGETASEDAGASEQRGNARLLIDVRGESHPCLEGGSVD